MTGFRQSPVILALDVATTLGFAKGIVGGAPISGSICFAQYPESSDNAIFANCLKWLSNELKYSPRPDKIVIEAMLPPFVKSNTSTRDRLAGLHGVVRGVAFLRGIFDIETHSVGDVRQHFIGERKAPRDEAKQRTLQVCRALGWPVDDTDAADACALWSYACSLIDPKQALKVSPLFNKIIRSVA